MTFQRTTDWALVKQIATHPLIYPRISDDFSPAAVDWEPIQHEAVWYVLAKDGDELLGMWVFVPENAVCWKVHTCLLPNAYGERGAIAAKEMAEWIWHNTPCVRINTDVPTYNLLARKFAEKAGMTEYGRNPMSYQKNGKLFDQYLLGMSRPEETRCH